MARKFKVKKGDVVVVLVGKDRGRSGEVLSMRPKENRLVVRGINMVKRSTRPSPTTPGGILEKEAAIAVSNVALADPKDGAPTRVGYRRLEDGRKVRFAKRSGEVIDR